MLRANTQENNDQMANSNQSYTKCLLSQNFFVTIQINGWTMADYIGIIDNNQKLKPYITITVTVIMIVLHEHIVTLLKGEFFN